MDTIRGKYAATGISAHLASPSDHPIALDTAKFPLLNKSKSYTNLVEEQQGWLRPAALLGQS
jgi:hypothetical protein